MSELLISIKYTLQWMIFGSYWLILNYHAIQIVSISLFPKSKISKLMRRRYIRNTSSEDTDDIINSEIFSNSVMKIKFLAILGLIFTTGYVLLLGSGKADPNFFDFLKLLF